MKSKTIKKLYTLHSWVGIVTGILLFVIAFTGAISVFGRPELSVWANPEARAIKPVDWEQVERLVEEHASQLPEHYKEEVLIFLPGRRGAEHLSLLFESHQGDPAIKEGEPNPAIGVIFEFDPNTYTLIERREGKVRELFANHDGNMADFIVHFHADLHLGRPIGLLTTGVLGLTLMLSIVTGIFIHRKILAQLFTFRPRKSLSLMLNDGHKVIGVWGLLFNMVIAFTGSFLGLVIVVLVPAAALVSFGGDQDKLIETFVETPAPVLQQIEKPTQVATILKQATQSQPEAQIGFITIKGYGDAGAMAYITMSGGEAVASQTLVFAGATGTLVERYSNFSRVEGVSGPILDLMFPLHFGNFGGIFIKAVWAILGLGTALLPLTGLMLWMERGVNAANPKYSLKTYQRFNRLIVGGCGGIVLACWVLFPAQSLLNQLSVHSTSSWLGALFFGTWLLALLWAAISPCEKQTARQMGYLVAIGLMLILPLDLALTATSHLKAIEQGSWTALGVDCVTFALGVWLFYGMKKFQPKSVAQEKTSVMIAEPERG